MKINHKLNTRLLGGVSVGLLVLLAAALICPLGESASAEDEAGSGMAMAQNAVDVKSMIAVALDSLVSTEVVPTSSGGTSAAVANMTVTTNSPNGFSVSMNGVNGTDLKAADKNNTAVIRSTTKNATLANLDANTWGSTSGRKRRRRMQSFDRCRTQRRRLSRRKIMVC